jgi:hypothetical protein
MTRITSVRVLSGAVDKQGGKVVLRGVISPETLTNLRSDTYQREAMPLSSQSSILSALEAGERLPDIELGMRGVRFREDKSDGSIFLLDEVYIIDGLQRVTGGIYHLGKNPGADIRIGATIYFNTTKEWEQDRFRVLNTARLKVSPNVLLRNLKERDNGKNYGLVTLYGLSNNDRAFPLFERVCWAQRMTRGELITALVFAKTSLFLHSHKGPSARNSVAEVSDALERSIKAVGTQHFRENVRTFFNLIDECWGIKRVHYRDGAVYMRGQFLYVLAKVLSDHYEFWQDDDEKKLFIYASTKKKLFQFPINDPYVTSLVGSGGKSRDLLYALLRDHLNRGRKTRRLSSRRGTAISLDDSDREAENEEGEEAA